MIYLSRKFVQRVAQRYIAAREIKIDESHLWDAVRDDVGSLVQYKARDEAALRSPYNRRTYDQKIQKATQYIDNPQIKKETQAMLSDLLNKFEKLTPDQYPAYSTKLEGVAKKLLEEYRRLSKEVETATGDHQRQLQRDLVDRNLPSLNIFVTDFAEFVVAQVKSAAPVDLGAYEREMTDLIRQDYLHEGKPIVLRLKDKLEKFCKATHCTFGLVIKVEADQGEYGINVKSPRLSVDFDRKWAPGFTVFPHGSQFLVEDVLSVGDRDFFDDPAEEGMYFDLVDYIRTGKLPGKDQGFIKLYRGMTRPEYREWQRGGIIPKGKFFTSNKSSALAQDIPGVYPDLYTFQVDRSVVRETDHGTFQLIKPARLEGEKSIVPRR